MLLGHVEEREFRNSGFKSVHSYANLAVERLEEIPRRKGLGFQIWDTRTKQKKLKSRYKVTLLLEKENLVCILVCSKSRGEFVFCVQ
jgi:hypothetical protein